jgi:DNA-binding PadR family transcriptional regulator
MKIKDLAPRGLLTTCILKLLKIGPKHGYEIIRSIKEETGWEPSPGSIYPTLHDLKKKGLIEERKEGRRISYRLTTKGKEMTEKVEESMKEMKNKFHSFIGIIGQIIGVEESELKRIMEIHKRKGKGDFLFLPTDIKISMFKTRDLILEIAKDKKKHKKLKKVLDEVKTKLEKIEGE